MREVERRRAYVERGFKRGVEPELDLALGRKWERVVLVLRWEGRGFPWQVRLVDWEWVLEGVVWQLQRFRQQWELVERLERLEQ